MNFRDFLNEQKWHHRSLDRVSISVIHRGTPDDRRRIPGDAIIEIGANGITLESRDGEVFIPYHRFLEVFVGTTRAYDRHGGVNNPVGDALFLCMSDAEGTADP